MSEFKPWFSGIGNDHTVNCAATTSHIRYVFALNVFGKTDVVGTVCT